MCHFQFAGGQLSFGVRHIVSGFKAIEASIDASDWLSIRESLRAIWPDVCSSARAFLAYFPTRAERVNRLLIYIRPDSGTLHVHACATLPGGYSSDIANIQIPYLESEYFKLPRLSDKAFEQEHASLMLQIKSAIKASCSPDLSPLPVAIVEYDDSETEVALAEISEAGPA